jgi:pimeloyl-ACP methyl ester carboxylesterase
MGGLLGIVMAAQPGTPVTHLVINDVGPDIQPGALSRIGSYVGADPTFATEAEFAAYVRSISPFGPHDDAQWEHLWRTTMGKRADGRFGFVYDPGIAVPFREHVAPPALWPLWDAIRCPTLLLRGAQSDLLSQTTAREMTMRGPKPALVEFPGVGHAPTLLVPGQVRAVAEFLKA